MAVICDLPIIAPGNDYSHTFRFWLDRAKTTPLSLAGRTYTAEMRLTPDSLPYATFTVDLTNLAIGLLTLTLANAITVTLPETQWYWELKDTTGGLQNTIFSGNVAADEREGGGTFVTDVFVGQTITEVIGQSATGPQGPPGTQGLVGPQGTQGPVGPPSITVSDTAPNNPYLNQLWVDTSGA